MRAHVHNNSSKVDYPPYIIYLCAIHKRMHDQAHYKPEPPYYPTDDDIDGFDSHELFIEGARGYDGYDLAYRVNCWFADIRKQLDELPAPIRRRNAQSNDEANEIYWAVMEHYRNCEPPSHYRNIVDSVSHAHYEKFIRWS